MKARIFYLLLFLSAWIGSMIYFSDYWFLIFVGVGGGFIWWEIKHAEHESVGCGCVECQRKYQDAEMGDYL